MAQFLESEGIKWVTSRSVCEELRRPAERVREKLIQSTIEYRLIKAPGRNGRMFKMLCIPATSLDEFKKIATTAQHYKKERYY